jgi:hypothetical protein
MQTLEAIPSDASETLEILEQKIRVLRERLAFYEGFDRLINENVAHARELFRLAAQEREAASVEVDRVRREAGRREAELRAELESLAADVQGFAAAAEALSARVSGVLRELGGSTDGDEPAGLGGALAVAVVAHGVSSVGDALSLQRFVASLPQVAGVTAREYAGGVLRIDARVHDHLRVEQFRSWEPSRRVEALTEREDVIEFELGMGSVQ